MRFFLTIRDIRYIKLSGAGTIKAPSIKGDSLELINSGAGSQTIENLDVTRFKVELSGAGSMDIAGKVDEQIIKLSGAGSYNGTKLDSRIAEVKLSGVGSAHRVGSRDTGHKPEWYWVSGVLWRTEGHQEGQQSRQLKILG